MAKNTKSSGSTGNATVAANKKARHEYFIEDTFEAGLALQGWEVKSLREGKLNLTESYVLLKNGEAWLLGATIAPLNTASTHITPDPTRTRKLLLNKRELSKIVGEVAKQGATCIPLKIYWKRGLAKCEIGLGKGKKLHDKRDTEKKRDWDRQKHRIMKNR